MRSNLQGFLGFLLGLGFAECGFPETINSYFCEKNGGTKMVRGNVSEKFRRYSCFVAFAALSAMSAQAATEKVISFALQQEPPQLNSMKATDQQSFFVIGHVMEGLAAFSK